MTTSRNLILILLLSAIGCAPADLEGRWFGKMTQSMGGQYGCTLVLEQNGSEISGTYEISIVQGSRREERGDVKGHVSGARLSFERIYREGDDLGQIPPRQMSMRLSIEDGKRLLTGRQNRVFYRLTEQKESP